MKVFTDQQITVDHPNQYGYEVYGPHGLEEWIRILGVGYRKLPEFEHDHSNKDFLGYPTPTEVYKRESYKRDSLDVFMRKIKTYENYKKSGGERSFIDFDDILISSLSIDNFISTLKSKKTDKEYVKFFNLAKFGVIIRVHPLFSVYLGVSIFIFSILSVISLILFEKVRVNGKN